jgi:hypothetical protein
VPFFKRLSALRTICSLNTIMHCHSVHALIAIIDMNAARGRESYRVFISRFAHSARRTNQRQLAEYAAVCRTRWVELLLVVGRLNSVETDMLSFVSLTVSTTTKDFKTMPVKATVATRAPRGTKTLTQAFFSAADGIPESQRGAVVKAALAAIRDQLKEDREKVKVAKAKVRGAKTPGAIRPKLAAVAPKRQPVVAAKGKSGKAKPGRKAAPKPVSDVKPETSAT